MGLANIKLKHFPLSSSLLRTPLFPEDKIDDDDNNGVGRKDDKDEEKKG